MLAGNTMSFIGSSGELAIDAVAQFGTPVGQASYTGPLIENFGTGDSIDLKNMGFAGATIAGYAPGSRLLQLKNGATLAPLVFQNSSLGAGGCHIGDDGSGHVLVSHDVQRDAGAGGPGGDRPIGSTVWVPHAPSRSKDMADHASQSASRAAHRR